RDFEIDSRSGGGGRRYFGGPRRPADCREPPVRIDLELGSAGGAFRQYPGRSGTPEAVAAYCSGGRPAPVSGRGSADEAAEEKEADRRHALRATGGRAPERA